MRTDPTPRGKTREYNASDRLDKIPVPLSKDMVHATGLLGGAVEAESSDLLKIACSKLLATLSDYYGVPVPHLKLLGPRPHRTLEGLLASEIYGDYHIKDRRIRLWTRTAMKQKWTSAGVILSTLCHEFMHHLDLMHLKFPGSFHTMGFYERTHRLYLAATAHPYYSLEWRPIGFDLPPEGWAIDWTETRRSKEKALARAEKRQANHRLERTAAR